MDHERGEASCPISHLPPGPRASGAWNPGWKGLLASCSVALQDSAPTHRRGRANPLRPQPWPVAARPDRDRGPGASWSAASPQGDLLSPVWEGSLQSGLVLGLLLLQTWVSVALFGILGFLKNPLLEESAEKMGLKWERLSQGDPTPPSEKGRAVGVSGKELPDFQTPALRPLPGDSVTGGTSFSMSEAFLPGPRGDLARRGCSGSWDSFLSLFPVRGLLATSQDLAVMCFRRAQSETPAPAPNAPG